MQFSSKHQRPVRNECTTDANINRNITLNNKIKAIQQLRLNNRPKYNELSIDKKQTLLKNKDHVSISFVSYIFLVQDCANLVGAEILIDWIRQIFIDREIPNNFSYGRSFVDERNRYHLSQCSSFQTILFTFINISRAVGVFLWALVDSGSQRLYITEDDSQPSQLPKNFNTLTISNLDEKTQYLRWNQRPWTEQCLC